MAQTLSIKEKINILKERISTLDTEQQLIYALKSTLDEQLDVCRTNLFLEENLFKNTKWLLDAHNNILTYIDDKSNSLFEIFKSLNLDDFERVEFNKINQERLVLRINCNDELTLYYSNIKNLSEFAQKYGLIIDKSLLDDEIKEKKLELEQLMSFLNEVL